MARRFVIVALIALAVLVAAWGTVRLPNLFGNDMVLQRDQPIAVWGWASPGEAIKVTLGQAEGNATANDAGEWRVQLPALHEADGLTLTVTGANTLTLNNLIMGDVWVCSGQSNMEMAVGGCNCPDDIAAADLPKIRRLKIDHVPAAMPSENFTRSTATGFWQVCSPKSVNGFTAAGFFFAREVFRRTGVPVGIIDVNWGGTPIEPWIAPEGLAGITELAALQQYYDAGMAEYRKNLPGELDRMARWLTSARAAGAAGQSIPVPPDPPQPAFWTRGEGPRHFTLYFGMIHPLVRFPIKGALWYQGEANGNEGDSYFQKMRALIAGWRSAWQQGNFPFYFVQLANYGTANEVPAGGDGWANLRNAQVKAMSIPNTGMATAVDIGDAADIHPKDKQDVGMRLALWALLNDYGLKDLVPSGPLFKELKVEENKIRISFDFTGSGLMIGKKAGPAPPTEDPGGKLARFAIAGEDRKWVWADAVIEGATVVVSSPKVAAPVAVRYAYAMNPTGMNLYNREGLPALPFRTDAW